MRILTGISPHGIVSTSAPSEPILALAASHVLTCNGLTGDTNTYKSALSTLVEKLIIQDHLLERGLQGELLARIILVVTRDCALPLNAAGLPVVYHHDTATAEPVIETITLGKFLTALLGDSLEKVSTRKGEHAGSASVEALKKWAQPYVLNFTHFAQVTKNITFLSSEFLFECWRGGAAVACACQQPVYDMLLVAYRGRLDKPFNPYDVGLISVQVKLRTGAAHSDLPQGITCPDIVHNNERWKPPHLAILMDLGTATTFQVSKGSQCEIGSDSVQQPEPESGDLWRRMLLPEVTEPSRFVLSIRGYEPYTIMRTGNVAEDLVTVFRRLNVPPVLQGLQTLADSMTVGLDRYGKLLPAKSV